jgi:putative FmdB family regulatory protein
MPFYEYQCKSCGHELEAMQKVSDEPLKKCPHCGKSQLQRLMSAPVFRLKGGGWYETDFKGDKDNQRNLADRPEEAARESKDTDSKAKDEKGGDAKDAKTADSKPSDAPAKEATSKEAKPEKPADQPRDKSSNVRAAQKPGAAKSSSRGARPKKKAVNLKRRG